MSERLPEQRGLYNNAHEHDSCGMGFVAHIKGKPSHDIIQRGMVSLNKIVYEPVKVRLWRKGKQR